MSRSGYSEDCDGSELAMWRGQVLSAIRGKRGQAFLVELAAALDAMPEKRLIREELVSETGECCTIGAVCKARGTDVSRVDCHDAESVGNAVGIARQMAAEIEYENDEYGRDETPEQRWTRMRGWVGDHIVKQGGTE